MTEYKVRQNLRDLAEARARGKVVRFVYRTKADDKLIARVGTVSEVDSNYVLVNDLFHNGAPRRCILDRIESAVEF